MSSRPWRRVQKTRVKAKTYSGSYTVKQAEVSRVLRLIAQVSRPEQEPQGERTGQGD